jgi:hypothetical protein
MAFVPVTPTVVPPSANAQELADQLAATVREFEQSHPGTSADDIRQALQLASSRFSTSAGPALVAVILGLMAAAGLFVLFYARYGGFGFTGPAVPMVLIALVVLGLLGVMVARMRP